MSSPADRLVGWQNNPERRGTAEIIWSCFFTITACTWSIQHLNLPAPDDGRWTKLKRKSIWAFCTLLFPEFILVHSILERKMAVHGLASINALPPPKGDDSSDQEVWTLTHAYFANMGGVRLILRERDRDGDAHNHFDRDVPLTCNQLVTAIRMGILERPPDISLEEIKDRSKSDVFTKGLALFQILWLVASLITRAVQKLATTQLEIVTAAFAVCTIVTYFACLPKPQDVETPTYVKEIKRMPDFTQSEAIKLRQPEKLLSYLLSPKRQRLRWYNRIPEDNFELSNSVWHPFGIFLCIVTTIFGSIHLIAWDFSFSSKAELILWRTSTLVAIAIPIFFVTANLMQRGWLWVQSAKRVPPPSFENDEEVWKILRRFIPELHPEDMRYHHEALLESHDRRGYAYEWRDCLDYTLPGYPQLISTMAKSQQILTDKEWLFLDIVYTEQLHDLLHGIEKERQESLYQKISDLSKQKRSPRELQHYNMRVAFKEKELAWKSAKIRKKALKSEAQQIPLSRRRRHLSYAPSRVVMHGVVLLSTGMLYLVARLVVLAIALSSLRSMPESTYVATWAKYLPFVD